MCNRFRAGPTPHRAAPNGPWARTRPTFSISPGEARLRGQRSRSSGPISPAPGCRPGIQAAGLNLPALHVPLEYRIRQVTCRLCVRQAACVYSLIRPPRTGFRRMCRVPTPVTVVRGGRCSPSGTRWAMPWRGRAMLQCAWWSARWVPGNVGGRPGLRRLLVSYFLAASLRCQASSGAGVTGKTSVQRLRGMSRASPANHTRSAGCIALGLRGGAVPRSRAGAPAVRHPSPSPYGIPGQPGRVAGESAGRRS